MYPLSSALWLQISNLRCTLSPAPLLVPGPGSVLVPERIWGTDLQFLGLHHGSLPANHHGNWMFALDLDGGCSQMKAKESHSYHAVTLPMAFYFWGFSSLNSPLWNWGTKSQKAAGGHKTRQQNIINGSMGPWSLAGMHQEERNLVSLSHEVQPSSLSLKGPQSHLAELLFSWGPSFWTPAFLATFQGSPRAGQYLNYQDNAAWQKVTEKGSSIPGDL